MRIAKWEFSPGLWPSIATLLLLPVLLSLGFWQLDRAAEKRQLQDRYAAQAALPAVPLGEIDAAHESALFRRVVVRGEFVAAQSLLLDNMVHDGQVGYQVLTPLRLADGTQVMVNRGWVPGGASRAIKPAFTTPQGEVQLQAHVSRPSGPGLRLGRHSYHDRQAPLVIQWLDLDEIGALFHTGFKPYLLRLEPDQAHGFVRDWSVISAEPEKSTGYAAQWFSLAALLLGLYLFLNLKQRR